MAQTNFGENALTNMRIFEAFADEGFSSNSDSILAGVAFIKNNCKINEESEEDLHNYVLCIYKTCKRRWTSPAVRRTKNKMKIKPLNIPVSLTTKENPMNQNLNSLEGISKNFGRPSLPFQDVSSPSRRRKVKNLLQSNASSDELVHAEQMKKRKEGHSKDARELKRTIQQDDTVPRPYTSQEALAFLIKTNMTKASYQECRSGAIAHNHNIYPPYNDVREKKNRCYPLGIVVSERGAEIPIQNLLNHTAKRICEYLVQSRLQESDILRDELTLISSYGFDGSSGQAQYKQAFSSDGFDDSNIFMASLVPLQLKNSQEKEIWTNLRPNSTLFCRPIRFSFEKESKTSTKRLFDYLTKQCASVEPTIEQISPNLTVSISHNINLTMIDGKVASCISETSSLQVCIICGASPKKMNDLTYVYSLPAKESTVQYGLSTLHCWIRCMEMFLKISYRLDFKSWQTREEFKKLANEKKSLIQTKFRNSLGLLIDIPLPGGSGTTNDGNTARTFFYNCETTAEILGINPSLIYRFSIILRLISSHHFLNHDAFSKYTRETAELYVQYYSWYPMPNSVHKLLVHGSVVAAGMSLPIGMMSEEAQESRNKDFKNFREHHSRQTNRISSNTDILHHLLVTSDPIISSMRLAKKKKSKWGDTESYPLEMQALLKLDEN